jgi:hypothetical protein
VGYLHGQDVEEFTRLTEKADSAYYKKNYLLFVHLMEQAFKLPVAQRPKNLTTEYYNLACGYSLINEKEKSILYLEKSLAKSSITDRRNYISAPQLASDPDLDNIRYEKVFADLLNKYFSKIPRAFFVEKITYSELLELIGFLEKEANPNDIYSRYTIIIKNKIIYAQTADDGFEFNTLSLRFPNLESLKGKSLDFMNCTFQLNLFLYGGNSNNIQPFPYHRFKFTECHFKGEIFIDGVNFIQPPQFHKSTFARNIWINANLTPTQADWQGFALDSCSIKSARISFATDNPISVWLVNNYGADSTDVSILCNKVYSARILDNKLAYKNIEIGFGETDMVRFTNNQFKNLIFHHTTIKSEFDFQNTEVAGKLILDRTFFTDEPQNDIDWLNLSNWRISSLTEFNSPTSLVTIDGRKRNETLSFTYLSGENPADIANSQTFRELMGLYSMFLNLYKNKNDIESYNGCYITIKELQSQRLRHLYQSNKTFETFFRWKLSQLLKFYVRHGTDPARAIVISLNIIGFFGIFFFFFPSDWDTTSKKTLIQNFKDFAQKNEKGYIKPFFILLGGLLTSLLNALTLSLNAFITLGFGNIPTHGIARYVCVLEGFLGWFLLSIFTVALINQVL